MSTPAGEGVDWVWSDWITPGLVPAKANIGQANAGAGVDIIGSTNPNAAADTVRTGGATVGSALDGDPNTRAPYTYESSGEVNADPFTDGFQAVGYDRSGVTLRVPPDSFAFFNVGYASGYWRERPALRQVPPEFWDLAPGVDWLPIDTRDPTWAGKVEFEPDADTVAVKWADVWLSVGSPESNDLGGTVGYTPGIPLAPTGGSWSGSFGAWPPPLGAALVSIPPSGLVEDVLLPATPPAGSDFTVISYTDMAVGAYSPNDHWQQWNVRPHGGPLGQALYIWHQMPRYRYRMPVPAAPPQRKPRFFVTYTEVEEDPRDVSHVVGIGKPADDHSVFRVPTPLGTLRELRHGENVSDVSVAYPLKVKLQDGSWTVVAGMTPDD